MKKILLAILPLISLVSCSSQQVAKYAYLDMENGLPTIHINNSDHVTYLLLSPFGTIESYTTAEISAKGAVSEKFYENTIVLKAEPGTKLPDKTQVKTSVDGASFRGWAYYDETNDHVWPDYFTEVQATDGLALKAIFDGTNAGGSSGGGGGGGSGGGGSGGQVETGYGLYFSSGTTSKGQSKGLNDEGYDEYLCSSVTFTAGQTVSMYDFGTKAKWIVDINPWSFGSKGDGANISQYLTPGTDSWTINQTFTADAYIQLMFGSDRIYFQLCD